MTNDRNITTDDVNREIDKSVVATDVRRGNELEFLQTVRRAKATSLRKERELLVRKVGERHPRVAEATAQIETNNGLLRDLAVETGRARTPTPAVDARAWILHGYVRDRNLQGVGGLTVALYDEKAVWMHQLGYACTDGKGYFALRATDISAIKQPVFVRVLRDGTMIYSDKIEMNPALGRVDSREIHLSDEGRVCAPPVGSSAPPSTPAEQPPTKTPEQPPAKTPDQPPPGTWVVKGRVTDQANKGVAGVFVSVYDKDLFFDDRLGQAMTDNNGNYSLTYQTDDFRDLIEKRPDLYLKVIDNKGNPLHTRKGQTWFEAGRVETIDIQITKKK